MKRLLGVILMSLMMLPLSALRALEVSELTEAQAVEYALFSQQVHELGIDLDAPVDEKKVDQLHVLIESLSPELARKIELKDKDVFAQHPDDKPEDEYLLTKKQIVILTSVIGGAFIVGTVAAVGAILSGKADGLVRGSRSWRPFARQ